MLVHEAGNGSVGHIAVNNTKLPGGERVCTSEGLIKRLFIVLRSEGSGCALSALNSSPAPRACDAMRSDMLLGY